MKQDEIIEMAMQAGLYSGNPRTPSTGRMIEKRLETFAKLVAAKERKACAKVCDDRAFWFISESPFFVEMHGLANVIRARAQAEKGEA